MKRTGWPIAVAFALALLVAHPSAQAAPGDVITITVTASCPRCGRREPEIKLTRDHIRPLSRGGLNVPENIQPLCGECNQAKAQAVEVYLPLEDAECSQAGNENSI